MEEKKISEMTEKEILRQQLELLAERSKKCVIKDLHEITNAMIQIASLLACKQETNATILIDGEPIAQIENHD